MERDHDWFFAPGCAGRRVSTVGADVLLSSDPGSTTPTLEEAMIGFRVAMVPEPSSMILAALGGLALLAYRRLLRQRRDWTPQRHHTAFLWRCLPLSHASAI